MRGKRIRFRELARGMAERDTEPLPWSTSDVLAFERQYVLPILSADDIYRAALSVIDEITHSFNTADATSRRVLETAKDENAVQEWLAEQFTLRASSRFHVHRESEVAEGNLPDVIRSSATAPVEVAIEAKHGDKKWTVTTLAHAVREQLAEDYLLPANRRHGIFVITRHQKQRWKDPDTGRLLDFAALVGHLSSIASALSANRAGPIEVAVRGIDAAPRARRRSPALHLPRLPRSER